MEFIDQSIKDLKLNIVTNLNGYDLNIIKQRTNQFNINAKQITIEANIIGASHSVTFKDATNKEIFTEVLANLDLSSNKDSVHMSSSQETNKVSHSFANNIQYSFTKKELDFSSKELVLFGNEINTIKEILNDSLYLKYTFPSTKEVLKEEYDSSTVLLVYLKNNSFIIQSIHYYPNEKKALISKSIVELIHSKKIDLVLISKKSILQDLEESGFSTSDINKIMDIIKNNGICLQDIDTKSKKAMQDINDEIESKLFFIKNIIDEKLNSQDIQNSISNIKEGINDLFNDLTSNKKGK
jgi:uncharacterized protein Smg (DUF494 family)